MINFKYGGFLLIKRDHEIKTHPSANNNKNDVKVYNNFSFTINFGDSLNLLALIGGVYFIRKIARNNKNKKLVDKIN
jgi:hypothetical protein